jgi:hypothetical protein
MSFLGLHSEVRKDLYQQIVEIVGRNRDPVDHNVSKIVSYRDLQVPQTFEDFPRLEKVAHAFYVSVGFFLLLDRSTI